MDLISLATGTPRRTVLLALGVVIASLLAAGCESETAAANAVPLTVELHFHGQAKVGQNAAEVHVEDADGKAVAGATVTVEAMMPMHGHGSTETALITDNGDGSYDAFPVTLQMAAAWTVTARATKGDASGEAKVDIKL